MPTPLLRRVDEEDDDFGWPLPANRPRPLPPVMSPAPRRARRSFLDVAWIVLAALGLAAAAGAASWYLWFGRGGSAELSVPRVVGLGEAEAVHELTTEGFAVRAVERPAEASAGVVFAQRPDAAVRLARGSLVTISVANGQTTRNMAGR